MKEQALKIVSDLIDDRKISGEDAVTLIMAISDNSKPQYITGAPIISNPIQLKDLDPKCDIMDVVINPHTSNPYPGTITTSVTGNINDDSIKATSSKRVEVIYG